MRGRLSIALGVLLCAGSVQAQAPAQPDYLVSISFFTAKPGQGDAFVAAAKKDLQPAMDALRAQGAVMAWGIDEADLHHPKEYTHSVWMAIPGLKSIDQLEAALEKGPKLSFGELTEPDRHEDLLLRSLYTASRPAQTAGRRFLAVKRFRVEAGKEGAWRAFFDKYYKPILDPLVADGTIEGHGLMTQEFVSQDYGTQWHWARATSREALGKMIAAVGAAFAKMTPAEQSMFLGERRSLIVPNSAHDDVWLGDFFPGMAPAK
jgi:hypothetical protein